MCDGPSSRLPSSFLKRRSRIRISLAWADAWPCRSPLTHAAVLTSVPSRACVALPPALALSDVHSFLACVCDVRPSFGPPLWVSMTERRSAARACRRSGSSAEPAVVRGRKIEASAEARREHTRAAMRRICPRVRCRRIHGRGGLLVQDRLPDVCSRTRRCVKSDRRRGVHVVRSRGVSPGPWAHSCCSKGESRHLRVLRANSPEKFAIR